MDHLTRLSTIGVEHLGQRYFLLPQQEGISFRSDKSATLPEFTLFQPQLAHLIMKLSAIFPTLPIYQKSNPNNNQTGSNQD